ncbi:hypothetical protein ACSCB1_35250 [Streptomyces europaeiscabiei]|uniref:hypothetical protein n=1 Tax=Streptomyces europaeiscabiei TaxID=146819 RepID=UPI000AA681BF|nr:hypothetical protein [Streptomyces europaeiscabiei]
MSDAEQKPKYSTDIEKLAVDMRTMSKSERCKALLELANKQHLIGFKNGKRAASNRLAHKSDVPALQPTSPESSLSKYWVDEESPYIHEDIVKKLIARAGVSPPTHPVDGELREVAFTNEAPDDKEWSAHIKMLNEWQNPKRTLRDIIQYARSGPFYPADMHVKLIEQWHNAHLQAAVKVERDRWKTASMKRLAKYDETGVPPETQALIDVAVREAEDTFRLPIPYVLHYNSNDTWSAIWEPPVPTTGLPKKLYGESGTSPYKAVQRLRERAKEGGLLQQLNQGAK